MTQSLAARFAAFNLAAAVVLISWLATVVVPVTSGAIV